jgi:glycine/D-amino acid oxidase-like deaminating enzyme
MMNDYDVCICGCGPAGCAAAIAAARAGVNTVSDADAWNPHKCELAIARCSWELVVHSPDDELMSPKLFHSKSQLYAERSKKVVQGEWFDIPYGALISKAISNLLLADGKSAQDI